MRFIKLILIAFLTSYFFMGCSNSQGDNGVGVTVPKVEKQASSKNSKPKTEKKAKSTNVNYWSSLKNELNLSGKQYRKLRAINSEYKKGVNALKQSNKSGNKGELDRLRMKVNDETKAILGEEKFLKKLAFDKTWKNMKK